MNIAFLILGFIIGLLLGIILEKRKSHMDFAKFFDEAMKDVSKIRKGEEARLYRQKIARRELIPSITLEKYLDEAIKRWRNELGISKTKEDKLIAKCNIDSYQSVRVSILGELLPKEEK